MSKPPRRPGVLAAIGSTPIVRLDRLFPGARGRIWAKLEFLNPGGSAKDRPALVMLESALASGQLRPGGTVIESSSGNMAIGLAQAARVLGLRLIVVVDTKTTATNLQLLEVYGAKVVVVQAPHAVTGDWLDARLETVQTLLSTIPGSWWSNQYGNPDNARAHAEGTAAEIAQMLGRPPSVLFAAASTCGTLGGLVQWRKTANASTRIVAVDVIGSNLFGAPPGTRRIPGIGSSRLPDLVDPNALTAVFVDDADCVAGCHHLPEQEAILGGGSSGALVAALHKIVPTLTEDDDAVIILMDRGERYLDTVYCAEWVRTHVTRPIRFSTAA